ncbi:2-oxoacid:ferredoxin oxidoreductase subunit gamma [Dactylosporangium fulvum]|uniref:2-oxoacid:acceptor oxidoreductase family protein n=1 Tax=Dactylosporangium fulvum TaxID=53359 RepID=A0ABY5VN86_9ACTN|nr:2-oxoacid:acceptor oxidoreductase family protein [Dactylosporangium fulvum]UWP78590.1 2-oxoacid:acceptor oxidoreductase family protein [Dactylosporangium fulvum]
MEDEPTVRDTRPDSGSAERELMVTGIGGQGIQLLAKTLALAATREGRYAMLAADYGGEMRGGPSKAAVVVGDQPLRALPILPSAGSAIFAHHRFAEHVEERLRPGALVVVNVPLVDPGAFRDDLRIVTVDARRVAKEAEAPNAAGFVLLGAYNAVTRTVAPQSLEDAMTELLPPYRRQHAEANVRALRAGAAALTEAAR